MTLDMRDGYHVLRGVLTNEDIGAIRAAITERVDCVARAMLTPFEASCPDMAIEDRFEHVARSDRAYASALLQVVMADVQHDGRIAGLARHPALAMPIAQLLSPATPSACVLRTRAAIPAFGDRVSPWHQDVVRPRAATGCATVRIACWIPLDDVDEHTGAIEVMPGTWDAPLPHEINAGGHFEIPAEVLPERERRVVPMRRGDVLLLDRFIPHRAQPMRGTRGRWSVVMWVKAGGGAC